MPNKSIYLESGLWRREQSQERDPLRVFPELFNANATGRSNAADVGGAAPDFEVVETAEGFLLSASIPGITAAQLQVRVTAQLVIVLRKEGPANVSTAAGESNGAAFRSTFVLPTTVDARRLRVDIADDRVTIKLPKRTPVRTQRVAQASR